MSNIFDICKVCFTFGKSNFTNMKTRFLFPYKWRPIGYILLIVSIGILAYNYFTIGSLSSSTALGNLNPIPLSVWLETIKNDLTYIALILGLLVVGFSKEQIEDEQISQLRLDSLQWAVYVNYIIFILCIIFIYGMDFLGIVLYNTITPLVFFVIRFRWKIYSLNRLLKFGQI